MKMRKLRRDRLTQDYDAHALFTFAVVPKWPRIANIAARLRRGLVIAFSETWLAVWLFRAKKRVPSVPTLSGALNPDNSVGLSWTASTDAGSGLAGYRIYRDGQSTPYATITPETTTYTDAGVNSGTTYTYTVTAFDGAGNESQPSNSVSVATP